VDEGSFTILQDSASSVNGTSPDSERTFDLLPRGAAAGEVDLVDVALARALADASAAGRFDVVLQLAKELEARRLERGVNARVPAGRPCTADRGDAQSPGG
jgi:purine nucleoside permease